MSTGAEPPIRDPYAPRATPPAELPTSTYATWALVVGVLAVLCSVGPGPVLGLMAIALGVMARTEIAAAAGRLGGRGLAHVGMGLGAFSFALFGGVLALYLTMLRHGGGPTLALTSPPAPAASSAPLPAPVAAMPAPATSSEPAPEPSASAAAPPATLSTITTIGSITVVDVAGGVTSLARELKDQRTAAAAHGETLLLETTLTVERCEPCEGVSTSLGDPRMQKALNRVRIVRIDRDQFLEDLEELQIPAEKIPGFAIVDSDLHVTDYVHGGEWDDDIAPNIAPVLGPFVRGTLTKRRSKWKGPSHPSGTVL